MARKFRSDYGVFACGHVFRDTRPSLLVIRDPDGQWQFLCAQDGCVEEDDGHFVGVGHLLEKDPTLNIAAELEPSHFYEREEPSASWEHGALEE